MEDTEKALKDIKDKKIIELIHYIKY